MIRLLQRVRLFVFFFSGAIFSRLCNWLDKHRGKVKNIGKFVILPFVLSKSFIQYFIHFLSRRSISEKGPRERRSLGYEEKDGRNQEEWQRTFEA
jgi:hypothetical protein